ncbi:MAG TPA: carboxypeptidase regulatory-like domain-containing protein [Vicinamibacterales bacterium]|nr:carboxypeptidase regulatory-like domain-containing protein [Vicinamibacterales bacterium]
MRIRTAAAVGVTCVVLTLGTTLLAEQRGSARLAPAPKTGLSNGVRFQTKYVPPGSGPTKVVGTVVDSRQVPVARVKVRLRNTDTGEVIAETTSAGDGSYDFPEIEPGNYVVEMFLDNRYVVAASSVGAVARSQTFNTVITLPGRWESQLQQVVVDQNVASFVGVSARTTMTAATLSEAITQEIRTVEVGVMVSPR